MTGEKQEPDRISGTRQEYNMKNVQYNKDLAMS